MAERIVDNPLNTSQYDEAGGAGDKNLHVFSVLFSVLGSGDRLLVRT